MVINDMNKNLAKIRAIIQKKRQFFICWLFEKYPVFVIRILYLLNKRHLIRIWDPWIVKNSDEYILFSLASLAFYEPFWSEGIILQFVSKDLKRWSLKNYALKPDKCEWRNGRMLAGSCVQENDKFYLFYSASPKAPNLLMETIGLAVSQDCYNWQRHKSSEVLIVPDNNIYGSCTTFGCLLEHRQCRDPYIFKCHLTNQYYLIFSAVVPKGHPLYRGCVGLAVSQSIEGPYKLLQPLLYPQLNELDEGIFYELERPQIIFKNGKYYLFFSAWMHTINPKAINYYNHLDLSDSCIYCYTCDTIEGSFMRSSEFIFVPGSEKTGLYGTNFIQDEEGRWFAYGWYPESFTYEVSRKFPVIWDMEVPRIIVSGEN
ncbi:beta-fructosidase [Brasilonema octagenarum UFV-E1]|uniref:Beta-fructosidase n=1 Tax=Brasilonema sennae CENA114 TaxID=415709 RepID=A0A856MGL8_9CYAN|nr:glycoside hydrolase family 68 protein [Brasilonema sennae]QDL09319.1 beta-fructosidase [Brasilonema sennae CENA114]QDL15676.1 beta-fructosidase [Brasilonema octagenarum UFV-E1]